MNTNKCNSTIFGKKCTSALFCMLFVVTACASTYSAPGHPLYGIDKTMTLRSLAVKRMAFILDCVGLTADTLDPTTSDKPFTKSDALNCEKEADSKFPLPAPIEFEELISYCKQEHDIPAEDSDTELQLSPKQITSFNDCMDEIHKYRPITYDD